MALMRVRSGKISDRILHPTVRISAALMISQTFNLQTVVACVVSTRVSMPCHYTMYHSAKKKRKEDENKDIPQVHCLHQ